MEGMEPRDPSPLKEDRRPQNPTKSQILELDCLHSGHIESFWEVYDSKAYF